MKLYYNKPTQVKFMDYFGTIHTGIAYKDEIICACCGGVYEIEDLLLRRPQEVKELEFWVDFTHEIDE